MASCRMTHMLKHSKSGKGKRELTARCGATATVKSGVPMMDVDFASWESLITCEECTR